MVRPSRRARRVRHQLGIGLTALAAGLAAGALGSWPDVRTRVSAATAYAGLVCIALSLIVGPLNVLRGRPNPVSTDLRRDFGICGGLVSLVHVGVGLTVHLRGEMRDYFLAPAESNAAMPIRLDAFGVANHLGLIAGLVLLGLLALSNDRMLGRLGAARWKAWQRLNYLGALAILGHGVLYQLLERRTASMVAGFAVVAAATAVMQGLGSRQVRRERGGRGLPAVGDVPSVRRRENDS
jgi:sulfoxide reductase heme-binding subunit YedZ